jgi:hypothetical protein
MSLFVASPEIDWISKCIGCSFEFLLKVGVEESIVNAPRIQITFCFVYVFTLQTDEW